jgi:DNA-binding transcriptional MerR regulator
MPPKAAQAEGLPQGADVPINQSREAQHSARRVRLESPAAGRSTLAAMDDDGRVLLTIGQLARCSGLPARTIRYWSDIGAVPPAGRTPGGYRLYDAQAVARLELVSTLRELGLGLADIQRVLAKETSVAEVAAVHVAALEAQIRTLRLRRAVLATVARRGSSTEEMALMNRLARLSAQERKQLIDDFLEEVFGGLDAAADNHLRQATPNLPDDPTPEQVDAWVELAELVSDPGFRRGVRALVAYTAQQRAEGSGRQDEPQDAVSFARRVVEHAGAARERGVAPESAEGAEVLERILGSTPEARRRAELLARLEILTDPRGERYWQLLGVINGWPPYPAQVPTLEQVVVGLRAHGWVMAALRAHS